MQTTPKSPTIKWKGERTKGDVTSILKNSSKSELAREIREGRLLIKGEEATQRGDWEILRETPREELEREWYCISLFLLTPCTLGKQSVCHKASHL